MAPWSVDVDREPWVPGVMRIRVGLGSLRRGLRRLGGLILRQGRSYWWVTLFALAAALEIVQPIHGDPVDRPSIFALAALVVVFLSLTFPVTVLIVQTHAERTMGRLLGEVVREAPWVEPLLAQAAAVLLIVIGGLVRPSMSTGAAAIVLLFALFVEGHSALKRMLDRMNPVSVLNGLTARYVNQIRREASSDLGESTMAERSWESLDVALTILQTATVAGDGDLVAAALSSCSRIYAAYLDATANRPWVYGPVDRLTSRLGVIVEEATQVSPVVILPLTIKGLRGLVDASTSHAPREGDFSLFETLIINILAKAAEESRGTGWSTAPTDAIRAIAWIGVASARTQRFIVVQNAIQTLTDLALSESRRGDGVNQWIGPGLLEIADAVLDHFEADMLLRDQFSRVVESLHQLMALTQDGADGTVVVLLGVPDHRPNLASVTLHALQVARRMQTRATYLPDEIHTPARRLFAVSQAMAEGKCDSPYDFVSNDAARMVVATVTGLIALGPLELAPDLFNDWFDTAIDRLLDAAKVEDYKRQSWTNPIDAPRHLAELLLGAYYTSLDEKLDEQAKENMRAPIIRALHRIAALPLEEQKYFTPALRLLGAAELKNSQRAMDEIIERVAMAAKELGGDGPVLFDPETGQLESYLLKPLADETLDSNRYGGSHLEPGGDLSAANHSSFSPSKEVEGVPIPVFREDHNDAACQSTMRTLEYIRVELLPAVLSWLLDSQYGEQLIDSRRFMWRVDNGRSTDSHPLVGPSRARLVVSRAKDVAGHLFGHLHR